MASFLFYKTFRISGIANGSTSTQTWVADADYVIQKIFIKRPDGISLTKSTFYFKIDETVYTRDIVPAKIIGEDELVSPELNIPFKKGQTLYFVFQNLEGSTIDVDIVFKIVSPS